MQASGTKKKLLALTLLILLLAALFAHKHITSSRIAGGEGSLMQSAIGTIKHIDDSEASPIISVYLESDSQHASLHDGETLRFVVKYRVQKTLDRDLRVGDRIDLRFNSTSDRPDAMYAWEIELID